MTMSARLKSYLDEQHVWYTLIPHTPAYTAQATAATLHVSGKEVAKTVVVRAGGETLLAVLPASYHLDLKKLGEIVGRKTELASEAEFMSLFPDCELGAMPPLGEMYRLPVYVDESLTADEEIVFHGGSHRDAIRMHYADFEALSHPTVGKFARKG